MLFYRLIIDFMQNNLYLFKSKKSNNNTNYTIDTTNVSFRINYGSHEYI